MENTTIEDKQFSRTEKTMLLASARNLVRNFGLKKDKLIAERNKIKDNFNEALEEEIKKRINEMRKRGALRLEKRLEKLNVQIQEIDDVQKQWEKPIIDATGHRMEEIFGYEMAPGEGGKNRLNVYFKYPETVLPPDVEPECPNHEDADDSAEIWDDEAVAAQTSEPKEEPQAVDELPTAKVPESEIPEYDSAGFSTEDGLAEGEPAELADKINDEHADEAFEHKQADEEAEELAESQWAEVPEELTKDLELGSELGEDEDEEAEETDNDDPFFFG